MANAILNFHFDYLKPSLKENPKDLNNLYIIGRFCLSVWLSRKMITLPNCLKSHLGGDFDVWGEIFTSGGKFSTSGGRISPLGGDFHLWGEIFNVWREIFNVWWEIFRPGRRFSRLGGDFQRLGGDFQRLGGDFQLLWGDFSVWGEIFTSQHNVVKKKYKESTKSMSVRAECRRHEARR